MSMFNDVLTLYESILAEQPYALILNAAVFIAILVCSYHVVYHIQVNNIIPKLVAKLKSDVKMQEKLREEEYKRQFELEGQFKSKNRMHRLNKKLISSGISVTHPEITAEVFVLIVTLVIVLVGFAVQMIKQNIIMTLTSVIVMFFLIALGLEILITINLNRLEKETVKFVNLLKNVSHTEGSVAEMLGRTIPYISNPLKANVERCYYEIKTTGDVTLSLQHLCDRTNYKKLQEIFEALRVCSTHYEAYETVINESSESVNAYIAYRKELNQIKQSNIIDIMVMGIMGVFIIYEMKNMLTNIDVSYYLFETLIGQAAIIALIVVFAYSIYNAIKND